MQEVILFYNGLGIPTRQILDSRGAIPSKTAADAKVAIQEMAEYSQKWHNGTSRSRSIEIYNGLAAIQAQLNNLGREITESGIKRQMSKVLQESGFGSLPSSTEANPRDQVKSISTTIEADSYPIRHIRSSQYAVSTGQNRTLMYETRQMTILFPSHLNSYYCEENNGSYKPQYSEAYSEASHSIPQKEKDPGSFTLPCFINNVMPSSFPCYLGTSFIVMHFSPTLNLGLDMPEDIKVPLILRRQFLSMAHAKIDVYKRKITLKVGEKNFRLMGETLVLNRSLDPFSEDYIELNDLNEPFELRRNQGDDLMPTIEEGEVIEEFRTRDEDLDTGIDDYPSYCDDDKKIHIDFLEDIDAYRDNEMGDIIFGEPFLREVGIKTKWFEGIITLYNGDNKVTYQMVRSHPKFKHHTNEQ
ncbi:hypothetical protein Tco_1254328 [Tanacetum coccineum]